MGVHVGWGKGGNVTSAGWQVTLCDPIWHVSSRSGDGKLLYPSLLFTLLYVHPVHPLATPMYVEADHEMPAH